MTLEGIKRLMDSEGNLDLHGRMDITALPDGLTVPGWLYLQESGITALPSCLVVGKGLDCTDAKALATLPDTLQVGTFLDLRGTAVKKLPDKLTVGTYLFLQGTAVAALPSELTVGIHIFVEGSPLENDPGVHRGNQFRSILQSLGMTKEAFEQKLAEYGYRHKGEIAKEIFAEIERTAMAKIDANLSVALLNDTYYLEAIDELKKKYTEEAI